jgi:hypothetical protein
MRRLLEGALLTAAVLTAGWLGGPLAVSEGSPLRDRTGSDPVPGGCNGVSTVRLTCPDDPYGGGPCGNQYNGLISGDLYYFQTLGTICTQIWSCTPYNYYGSTPVYGCGSGT